jgi:IS6 family transposase
MPITPDNPFKGRQHSGELIVLCVRLYLRYPLSYEHVTELMAERGVEVDASCIWRGYKRMHRNWQCCNWKRRN